MLTLKTAKDGLGIASGQNQLILAGNNLSLDELSVSEPGEYEKSGVEIVYGEQAALIIWEKLQMVYVFKGEKPASFEKSQFAPCDILIINDALAQMEKATFNELLEIYDPRIVVTKVSGTEVSEAVDNYKISTQSLPEEGRQFIALT